MTALFHPPPLRTPSPKIRIHRSQSFDSPSSRISVTPIDDSPYSKSTSAIGMKPTMLPKMDVLAASRIHRTLNISEDTVMSDASDSSAPSSPSGSESSSTSSQYGLFTTDSPGPFTQAPHPTLTHSHQHTQPAILPSPSNQITLQITPAGVQQYQDPLTPMHDPWLVRMVLNLYDERGFDWMNIAEVIERCWGVRTGSAEVLGILSGNGRMKREWWD